MTEQTPPRTEQTPPQAADSEAEQDAELALVRERAIILHQALAGAAVGLLLAALIAPLLLAFDTAVTVWWVLAVLGLLLALAQIAVLVYRQRLQAEHEGEPTLERPEPEELDFDEPWQEAANP